MIKQIYHIGRQVASQDFLETIAVQYDAFGIDIGVILM
jgi:hypothetical protein